MRGVKTEETAAVIAAERETSHSAGKPGTKTAQYETNSKGEKRRVYEEGEPRAQDS